MKKRIVTGVLIALALIILVCVQGWGLRLTWFVCMAISIGECYHALALKGFRPVRWVGFLYAAAALPAYLYLGGEDGLVLAMLACFCIGMGAIVLTGQADLPRAVATVLPIVYPGFLFSLMFPLQDQSQFMMCVLALMMLFVIPLMGDVGAYFVGCKFGRHKLSPVISPKKTIEGAVGGLAFSVISAVLFAWAVSKLPQIWPAREVFQIEVGPLWHYAVLGLAGGVFSQFGDLTASMIKRYCGVKDYGRIFPGHGGMLDRFDSVLFMSVITYAYFILLRG